MSPRVRVEPLGDAGAFLIRGLHHLDARGSLRKVLTASSLADHGLALTVDEVLTTHNRSAGTVRGLHHQVAPHEQTKVLWVTRGSLVDVVVDVRPASPTYGRVCTVLLSADDDTALLVGPGLAHGYQTTADDTDVTYLIEGAHSPDHARTLRWDDPALGILWPLPVSVISEGDKRGDAWPGR